jgi:nucleoside-diphosphate-sugar epimerase
VRILLTGAAGFVGSHLADRLVAEGHSVVGVDNLSSGRLANIAQLRTSPRFSFMHADVTEPLGVEGHFDWIMHLASPASPPAFLTAPIETLRVNGEGTRLLLDLARTHGAGFVLASTSEVYGDPLEHPQTESYWGNVNPIGPRSVYDEGKRYAESMTVAYGQVHAVPIRICRIFNTYGPRMRPDDGRIITNFIVQALRGTPLTIYGDGRQTRSFTYVDDLVGGIVRLLGSDIERPVNLGNPKEYSVLEVADLIRKVTGSASTVEFVALPQDDPLRRQPDISLARAVLGWEPQVALDQGLLPTITSLRGELEVAR